MAVVKIYNLSKKEVGEIDLDDRVFNVEPNESLVHQVVVAQLAGRRRGTACTKTKGEVRGGGKKPFRQKGTGRARQGSNRSPLMPGGGQTFGPRPRSYFKAVPKKMAVGAICSALSDKLRSERLVVVDEMKFQKPQTKKMAEVLQKTFGFNKALVVDEENKTLMLSTRNLPRHKFLPVQGVNVYDLVNHDWLVLSKNAADALVKKYASSKTKKTLAGEDK